MSIICCYDDDGLPHLIPADSLAFAPAVYGTFIEDNRVLLLKQRQGSFYMPPGCILGDNETPTQVIRHYFRRLVEATLDLGALLLVEEQYRWLNGSAHRITALYYALERPSTASICLNETLDPQTYPVWVDLFDVQRNQFQFGFSAVMAAIAHLRTARA